MHMILVESWLHLKCLHIPDRSSGWLSKVSADKFLIQFNHNHFIVESQSGWVCHCCGCPIKGRSTLHYLLPINFRIELLYWQHAVANRLEIGKSSDHCDQGSHQVEQLKYHSNISWKMSGQASDWCWVGSMICWKTRKYCTKVTYFESKDARGPLHDKESSSWCVWC